AGKTRPSHRAALRSGEALQSIPSQKLGGVAGPGPTSWPRKASRGPKMRLAPWLTEMAGWGANARIKRNGAGPPGARHSSCRRAAGGTAVVASALLGLIVRAGRSEARIFRCRLQRFATDTNWAGAVARQPSFGLRNRKGTLMILARRRNLRCSREAFSPDRYV